jgi:hypothetical protein
MNNKSPRTKCRKTQGGIERPLTGAGELVFIEPFSSLAGSR